MEKHEAFPLHRFPALWEGEFGMQLAGDVEELMRTFAPEHLEERVSLEGEVVMWAVQ